MDKEKLIEIIIQLINLAQENGMDRDERAFISSHLDGFTEKEIYEKYLELKG